MINPNNVKRFLGYLLYTILIALILYKCSAYEQLLKHWVAENYKPLPYQAYISVYPIVIGFLIGLPKLICNIFKKGIWHFDLIKFIAVGLPTLLITTIPIVCFSPFLNHSPITKLYTLFYQSFLLGPRTIAGIVFGYLMCLVLYKRDLKTKAVKNHPLP